MRKTLLFGSCLILLLSVRTQVCGQTPARTIRLDVTGRQKVVSRDIGAGLLLRVVKERSARHEHFGWRLEVVRKPYRRTSRNLLYQNKAGVGADESQVYAWHLAEQHFPNARELRVKGYPYTVSVLLVDCVVEGRGEEARFVSGEMRVSWARQR